MDQWRDVQGIYNAAQDELDKVISRLEVARDLPAVLYDEAPGPYARRLLGEIRPAIRWLEWLRRIAIDEALATGTLTQRELAEAAGVGTATIQRWSKTPLAVGEDGEIGPGGEERSLR